MRSEIDARSRIAETIADGGFLGDWTGTWMTAAERLVLERYRDDLSGRVLEFGVGGGRITRHLTEIAADLLGIDIAPDMVAYCREHYRGHFEQEDLRNIGSWPADAWDAVFSGCNSFDLLTYEERTRLLADTARLLHVGGIFVFTSHNAAVARHVRRPWSRPPVHPRAIADWAVRMPRRMANLRRVAPFQEDGDELALVVDDAQDYTLLQVYISRDRQERDLAAAGLELVECLDEDGGVVPRGASGEHSVSLMYVARRVS
jgi:SAM-dependent methyltransferase